MKTWACDATSSFDLDIALAHDSLPFETNGKRVRVAALAAWQNPQLEFNRPSEP